MNKENNNKSFFFRFLIYQNERFPFLAHGVLISAFSFSAIAYSRLCRNAAGFVDMKEFFICIFNTITLFFLVRIFDEFKDKEDDALYRKYLPVPRGLISLKELKTVGIITFLLQLIVNIIFAPKMLILFFIIIGYLLLMSKEFFATEWLKKHQFWYVVSHMFIIPLVDIFASGFDWLLEGAKAPNGLILFFAVSYMNGIVLEIGRKIKTPEMEEVGVLSYTHQLGSKRAPLVWLLVLLSTLLLAFSASKFAHHSSIAYLILFGLFIICSIPAILFVIKYSKKSAKFIEYSSALWTFGMYLTLGGIPMLLKLLFD